MTRLEWLALLAVSLTTAAAASADEAGRGWQFEVAAPYLWIPEEHGHIGLDPVSVPVDVEFDGIFDLMGKGDLLGGAGHFGDGSTRTLRSTSAAHFSASAPGSKRPTCDCVSPVVAFDCRGGFADRGTTSARTPCRQTLAPTRDTVSGRL